MNLNSKFDPSKLAADARISKTRLHNFYSGIISTYFNKQLILKAKQILNSEKGGKNFKTDHYTYQFYTLFSFSIQDTLFSARKFYGTILYHPVIIRKLSVQNPIKLLCLECEALPTVIGVCEVINEIVSNRMVQVRPADYLRFSEVRILVIDKRQNWKRLCQCIVNTFNSCFKNIQLQLDFVDDFISLPSEKLLDLDLVIIARIFTEHRTFSQNYSSLPIVLNKMKKDAVLFYFDSCNESYYADLHRLISEKNSFSQVSCQTLSFEDLNKKREYLDLMYWDIDFQPVMYATWINVYSTKEYSEEITKIRASYKLNSSNLPEKYSDVKVPALRKPIYESTKTTEHSNNNNDFSTSTQTNISKTTKASDIVKQSKLKSLAKHCNLNVSTTLNTLTDVPKAKHKPPTSNISDVPKTLTPGVCKYANDSKVNKPSRKSQCLKMPSDVTISQKEVSEAKTQDRSSNELEIVFLENCIPTMQTILEKRKAKAANSKVSGKMATSNKYQTFLSKQTGNASPSQIKTTIPKDKKKGVFPEKSSENKIDPQSTFPKGKCGKKSRKKKSTKKTIANNNVANINAEKFYLMKEERKTNFKTNTAGQKLSQTYRQKKYKYLYRKKKSNGETVKRNKIVEQFVIKYLQINYSDRKQRSSVETVENRKAVQKLSSTNQQKNNEYKCPHFRTEESVSNYAEFLSEIYYFRNFKRNKYFNDKIRDIPKNLCLDKYVK